MRQPRQVGMLTCWIQLVNLINQHGMSPILDLSCVSRHRITANPIDDRDEEIELKRPNFPVIDDLRRISEVDVADD